MISNTQKVCIPTSSEAEVDEFCGSGGEASKTEAEKAAHAVMARQAMIIQRQNQEDAEVGARSPEMFENKLRSGGVQR